MYRTSCIKAFDSIALNEFLRYGIVKNANYRITGGEIKDKYVESSVYTEYITIESKDANLENIFTTSFTLYTYVPKYSGAGYNCSHFVSQIVSKGSSYWNKTCNDAIISPTIPNIFFEQMSIICQNATIIPGK